MVRLEVLGACRLVRQDRTEIGDVVRQPRQLALLTYLALARPRGFVRRDSLVTLFWLDLDEAHARGALSQTLYRLRRSLPSDVVISRGREEVGLAEGSLECDALTFESRLDAGRPREALEVYRGDFLDGFHLGGGEGWERWAEEERRRLRSRASDGAWAAALLAGEERDSREVLRWGLRAHELMPADETRLRTMLRTLDDLGDRAAAVHAYERAAALLVDDYGIEPSAETRRLITEIRGPADGRPTGVFPDPSRRRGEDSVQVARRERAPDLANDEPSPDVPTARPHPVWSKQTGLAGLAVVALVSAAGWSIPTLVTRTAAPIDDAAVREVAERAHRQGRYRLARADRTSLLAALDHFEAALEADAGFAPAWGGLSSTYLRLTTFGTLPPDDGYPRAVSAAERALAIDPGLAEAHVNLATVLSHYEWDTDSAQVHFERALESEPDSPHVLHRYSAHLRNLGRLDEALAAARKAAELDPLAPLPRIAEGGIHYVAGRYDEAIRVYRGLLESDPDEAIAYKFLAMAESMRGSYPEALEALDRFDPDGGRIDAVALRGYIQARKGDRPAARRTLETLEEQSQGRADLPFHVALVLVGLGEHDSALDLLERSLQRPTGQLRVLGTDPHFIPLRSDPRFEALLTAVDLAGSLEVY